MQNRYMWTSFSRSGNPTSILDIALVFNTTLAIIGTSQSKDDVYTTQVGGNSNVFFMLIPVSTNTLLPKYKTPPPKDQYPNIPQPVQPSIPPTPPTHTNQIERPYVTPNSPYTAQEGRNLMGLEKYFQNIRNTLTNPSLTNLQKLEVVKVNPITPRDPQARKLYILLAGEFNRKKDYLLASRRSLSADELVTLYTYTENLYNVAMTMDQKIDKNLLRTYLQQLLKSYKAMQSIR